MTSTACFTSIKMAGSPSLLRMILVWPSHVMEDTTHFTVYESSSAPLQGIT